MFFEIFNTKSQECLCRAIIVIFVLSVNIPLIPHKSADICFWFYKVCLGSYTNPAFSAINPILYNALSTKFRRAFRRTLHCGEVRVSGSGGTGLPTPSLTYLANTRLSTVSMMQAGDTFNMHRSVLLKY